MLAFLFTSYELFVTLRLMPQVAADNRSLSNLSAQKERCLFMHARLVYYVYIGKSRDFTRIYCNSSAMQWQICNFTAGAGSLRRNCISVTIGRTPGMNNSAGIYYSTLSPFPILHSSHNVRKLLSSVLPPRETGITWSTWSLIPSFALLPHNTHRNPSLFIILYLNPGVILFLSSFLRFSSLLFSFSSKRISFKQRLTSNNP